MSGIEHDEDSPLALLIYPNPNTGNYTIDYTGEEGEALSVVITDLSGRQIKNEQWKVRAGNNKRSFDLSAYPAGVYLTVITGSEGSTTVKIMKQ